MRTIRLVLGLFLMLLPLVVSGCGSSLPEPTVNTTTELASNQLQRLRDALTDAGLSVAIEDDRAKPSFWYNADYDLLRVEDQPLQAFSFATEEEAQAAEESVSDDGFKIAEGMSQGLLELKWSAPPHFFRKDELVVIYVDELARTDTAKSAEILSVLRSELGEEFAEGPPLEQ